MQYLEESIKLLLVPDKVSKVGDKTVALFIRGFIIGVLRINTWAEERTSVRFTTLSCQYYKRKSLIRND